MNVPHVNIMNMPFHQTIGQMFDLRNCNIVEMFNLHSCNLVEIIIIFLADVMLS